MKTNRLNDIILFVKVITAGSFTAAADEMGISKSMVSKRISLLEKNLKTRLMHRTTRKLTLTEAGDIFYARCLQISQDLEDAELAVTYMREKPRGTLRITSPVNFGRLHLIPAIHDYSKKHKEVNVECYFGEAYENILDNCLDLAIKTGDLPDSSLHSKLLARVNMLVCASPAYLKKHDAPKKPSDLTKHNCLRYHNSPTGDSWHFRVKDKLERIRIRGNLSANHSLALEAAAVDGQGIVMLPGYLMLKDIQSGHLKTLLDDFSPEVINVYAVYPSNRHLAPKVRTFIDFLAKRFGEASYWQNRLLRKKASKK